MLSAQAAARALPTRARHARSRRGAAACRCAHGAAAPDTVAAVDELLQRTPWLLRHASSAVTTLPVDGGVLRVVRDDLLHPHIAGNKARKLDGLLPALLAQGVTDVVTCGGVHSAHAAAVAAASAAAGLRAHLLLRGERPAVLTGHALLSSMFAASATFVTRDAYADRDALLGDAAAALRRAGRHVGVVPEGGACAAGCLGVLRAVRCWSSDGSLDAAARIVLVVDSGTGATAWSLALAISLLRLPWRVLGVPVASDADDCSARADALQRDWDAAYPGPLRTPAELPLAWAPAAVPRRRFGAVRPGDIAACHALARATGILVDPVWGLHAYRAAAELADGNPHVVWLHTGGAAGALEGVAQRWPELVAGEAAGVCTDLP
jgi:D-cysteine desulfhydrase